MVFAAGRSLVTTTLFKVIFPELLTTPVKPEIPPGTPAVTGQISVTVIAGAVVMEQVALAVSVTGAPQRLFAVATSVSETEQFVGAG
jgi:hypothetical protein